MEATGPCFDIPVTAPFHGHIEAYFLHRGRRHWYLYIQDLEPNFQEHAWIIVAFCDRKNCSEKQAASHLMVAMWTLEKDEFGVDHFHWINEEGALSVAEWMAIARAVWPEPKDMRNATASHPD